MTNGKHYNQSDLEYQTVCHQILNLTMLDQLVQRNHHILDLHRKVADDKVLVELVYMVDIVIENHQIDFSIYMDLS